MNDLCGRKLVKVVFAVMGAALYCAATTATAADIRAMFDTRVPMRDGTKLSADIWLPAAEGKYPAILMRTPYVKALFRPGKDIRQFFSSFSQQGYAAVYQDMRGRGDSDGEFLQDEGQDGYDTIEWIARQPWSNGSVCMMGVSALAAVQWAAARMAPPHLKCFFPIATGAFQYVIKTSGAIGIDGIQWAFFTSGQMMQPPFDIAFDWNEVAWHRPLITIDEKIGRSMPLVHEFLKSGNYDYDPFVKTELKAEDFRRIAIPGLHVTGWFDMAMPGTMMYWNGLKDHSPARDRQYLLIGPWDHVQTMMGGETRFGEMEFTEDSIVDIPSLHSRFFDHYLKGLPGEFDFPVARLYITGSNQWRDFDVYPPAESTPRRFYLGSGGHANTLGGDGVLSAQAGGSQASDSLTFDPQNPVPSGLGDMAAPKPSASDQREIEAREDVLVYTSEALADPLEDIGPITVELYAATDGRDTDFTAKLVDVYPDGRAVRLGSPKSGIIRARFRNGLDHEELLTPGKVEKYVVDLSHLGHTFLPGHRIRVEISSSVFPLVLPNQNTGNPIETDTEWRIAHQTIQHGEEYPSALVLPVFPSHGHPGGLIEAMDQ